MSQPSGQTWIDPAVKERLAAHRAKLAETTGRPATSYGDAVAHLLDAYDQLEAILSDRYQENEE